MAFRAEGTSVVRDAQDGTAGVAMAFDPDMARRIADALNKESAQGGGRGAVDPLTGKKVNRLDVDDRTPLVKVLGTGRFVKITGPYATAQMDTPGGREVRSLATGAILPGDVAAGHARHLIDVGLAEVVEAGSARKAHEGTSGQQPSPGPAETGDGRPSVNAPKADWVAYHIDQRPEDVTAEQARAEAEAMNKPTLIERAGRQYGTGDGEQS